MIESSLTSKESHDAILSARDLSNLIAWISSSILFLIIFGSLFVRCRRWYLNRSDDKCYYSAVFSGNVSHGQGLQNAQDDVGKVDTLNTRAATHSDGAYETIPDNALAIHQRSNKNPKHPGSTSPQHDIEMDESGYMIPQKAIGILPVISGEMILVHQTDDEMIQHSYFHDTTCDTTCEEGDIHHAYQTPTTPTDISLETSEQWASSNYENVNVISFNRNHMYEDAIRDMRTIRTQNSNYMKED